MGPARRIRYRPKSPNPPDRPRARHAQPQRHAVRPRTPPPRPRSLPQPARGTPPPPRRLRPPPSADPLRHQGTTEAATPAAATSPVPPPGSGARGAPSEAAPVGGGHTGRARPWQARTQAHQRGWVPRCRPVKPAYGSAADALRRGPHAQRRVLDRGAPPPLYRTVPPTRLPDRAVGAPGGQGHGGAAAAAPRPGSPPAPHAPARKRPAQPLHRDEQHHRTPGKTK